MALSDVAQELNDRRTFGADVVLNDRRLRVDDGLVPERVAILGATSNSAAQTGTTEYLIETGQPFRLLRTSELKYFRNGDPEQSPSEITLAYEDAYNSGARSFEFTIVTRTVATLAGDLTTSSTTVPVSTIYTNKVTSIGTMGADPLLRRNAMVFEHNSDIFVVGGERPNTPAAGDITAVAKVALTTGGSGDYITFTHTDGTVFAFWFSDSGSIRPTAVDTLVTAGATAVEVDVTSDTSADDVSITLGAAITATTALPIVAFDSGAGTLDLESDEDGADGNDWTLAEVVGNAGFLITSPTGGSATNTISRRVKYFDPATDTWNEGVDANGLAMRLVVARRDAAVCQETAAQYNMTGGMTTILGGADTAVATVDDITFASASSSVISSIAAGTAVNNDLTTIGEALFVKLANNSYVIFGGQTGSGTRSDMVATYVPSTGVATDTTKNLDAATRWLGGYYEPVENHIYVFGGETASGAISDTVIWDQTAGDFSATTAGSMSDAKYDFAFGSQNGAGWAMGGTDGTNNFDTIERFDPDSKTWQKRSTLGSAHAGCGMASGSDLHLYFVCDTEGHDYNIGLGNLEDQFVGFSDPSTPYYIQVDWEIMSVTGHTTTRSRGRDVDAMTVTRAQKGSTAEPHIDFTDIYEGPEALFDDLDTAYENMINSSTADYILPPMRAVADCPYLPDNENFAYQAANYCYLKTKADRPCMAALGVFPANENPAELPTLSQDNAWITKLNNFSRTNHLSQSIWLIGDGVTDANGDGKPDTYGFWATTDGAIPTGAPPMDAGDVVDDEDGNPIDIGKHLFIVRSYGFGTAGEWAKKFPNATLGYMRPGAAAYVGMTTTLEPSRGGTNAPARGFEPHRTYTFVQENQLATNRYVGVVNRGSNGSRWDVDYTWAYNVSVTNRSDWVLGATFRRVAVVLRSVNDLLVRYYGEPVVGPHRNAMETDLAQVMKQMVANNIIGPNSDYELVVDDVDRILGQARIILELESVGELIKTKIVASLK